MPSPQRRWTASEKRLVGARQEWRCADCAALLPATFECDHVQPLHDGGLDQLENAEALCQRCHGAKTLRERIAFERKRAAAIREAKAKAQAELDDLSAAEPSPRPRAAKRRKRPLSGLRPALEAHASRDVLENRFLKFAYEAKADDGVPALPAPPEQTGADFLLQQYIKLAESGLKI